MKQCQGIMGRIFGHAYEKGKEEGGPYRYVTQAHIKEREKND